MSIAKYAALYDREPAFQAALIAAIYAELAKRLAESIVTDSTFADQFLTKAGNPPDLAKVLSAIPR